MRILIQKLMENPSALGQHVILPRLLLASSVLEKNLGGVEAVHVPFPHAVKTMDLLGPVGLRKAVGVPEFHDFFRAETSERTKQRVLEAAIASLKINSLHINVSQGRNMDGEICNRWYDTWVIMLFILLLNGPSY
ncbi:hypothetical protein JHK87_046264 [Glycine soja]|nr:hypothetical protein JHK87_046264 [Glycine soja]